MSTRDTVAWETTATRTTSRLLTNAWWPIAVYVLVLATIGFVTTFFSPETRGRSLSSLDDVI